ncbi:MAG: alpha/beta hydrolase [Desulfococcus multivorans]|jgi:alpha-beta hydrolase superfamily lysophospholipase|nr:alpha/beta hydrolase [Desulfococcus multivorans]
MSETESIISTTQDISFNSGDFQLKGTLHLPPNSALPPVVIGSHGLFSTGDSPKQIALAEKCLEFGIAYFRFDHRGCGGSDGVFGEVTAFENRRRDLLSAISAVRATEKTGDVTGLFGSSLGGAVVLSVALEADVAAVVTYAATLDGNRIVQHLKNGKGAPHNHPKIDPEALRFDISDRIDGIHHILIVHGDSDRIISSSEAHRIYQKARMPKRLIMLRNGDHPMSLPENQEKFVREAALWFKSAMK